MVVPWRLRTCAIDPITFEKKIKFQKFGGFCFGGGFVSEFMLEVIVLK